VTPLRRLLLVAFFLETGFLLFVVPWSAYWDRNYFGQWLPVVRDVMTNNFVRGAVSGLGIVNVAAGIGELVALFVARRATRPWAR
jgi:hypothetical protein